MGSRVLAGCVLFQGLPEDALDAAETSARTVARGRGQVYFRQGEPATHVYAVVSGQVKLVAVHPDGRAVIHRLVGPGEVFGGLAMLGEQLYPVTAESWEESTALAWTGEDLHQLVLRYPQTALNLLRMAAGRVRELQARVEELVAERVERRIARAVLRLVRHAGRRSEEGVVIDLPLSREDLAKPHGDHPVHREPDPEPVGGTRDGGDRPAAPGDPVAARVRRGRGGPGLAREQGRRTPGAVKVEPGSPGARRNFWWFRPKARCTT